MQIMYGKRRGTPELILKLNDFIIEFFELLPCDMQKTSRRRFSFYDRRFFLLSFYGTYIALDGFSVF